MASPRFWFYVHRKEPEVTMVSTRHFKFCPCSKTGSLDLAGLTSLLSEKIKEFLQEKKVQTFYQQDLEMVESLQSLASQPVVHSTCSDKVSGACS